MKQILKDLATRLRARRFVRVIAALSIALAIIAAMVGAVVALGRWAGWWNLLGAAYLAVALLLLFAGILVVLVAPTRMLSSDAGSMVQLRRKGYFALMRRGLAHGMSIIAANLLWPSQFLSYARTRAAVPKDSFRSGVMSSGRLATFSVRVLEHDQFLFALVVAIGVAVFEWPRSAERVISIALLACCMLSLSAWTLNPGALEQGLRRAEGTPELNLTVIGFLMYATTVLSFMCLDGTKQTEDFQARVFSTLAALNFTGWQWAWDWFALNINTLTRGVIHLPHTPGISAAHQPSWRQWALFSSGALFYANILGALRDKTALERKHDDLLVLGRWRLKLGRFREAAQILDEIDDEHRRHDWYLTRAIADLGCAKLDEARQYARFAANALNASDNTYDPMSLLCLEATMQLDLPESLIVEAYTEWIKSPTCNDAKLWLTTQQFENGRSAALRSSAIQHVNAQQHPLTAAYLAILKRDPGGARQVLNDYTPSNVESIYAVAVILFREDATATLEAFTAWMDDKYDLFADVARRLHSHDFLDHSVPFAQFLSLNCERLGHGKAANCRELLVFLQERYDRTPGVLARKIAAGHVAAEDLRGRIAMKLRSLAQKQSTNQRSG